MAIRTNIAIAILDRNRFDPVNHILKNKHVSQFHDDLMRQHRVRRRRTNIKKKRSRSFQDTSDFCSQFSAPLQIRFSALAIRILPILNPEVVWGGRDRYVNATIRELRHFGDAIAKTEIMSKEPKNLLSDWILNPNHLDDSYQSHELYRESFTPSD